MAECHGADTAFDVLRETFSRTSLGQKGVGDVLNLERALRVGDSLGGHMVTGHVDGVGYVRSLQRQGGDWVLEVACVRELLDDMVPKGSVAMDGVSLTIANFRDDSFIVHIIPHTWDFTSCSTLRVGDAVNIETDVLGKYVRRLLRKDVAAQGVSWDSLVKSGFLG